MGLLFEGTSSCCFICDIQTGVLSGKGTPKLDTRGALGHWSRPSAERSARLVALLDELHLVLAHAQGDVVRVVDPALRGGQVALLGEVPRGRKRKKQTNKRTN